jgi:hypothetical protein
VLDSFFKPYCSSSELVHSFGTLFSPFGSLPCPSLPVNLASGRLSSCMSTHDHLPSSNQPQVREPDVTSPEYQKLCNTSTDAHFDKPPKSKTVYSAIGKLWTALTQPKNTWAKDFIRRSRLRKLMPGRSKKSAIQREKPGSNTEAVKTGSHIPASILSNTTAAETASEYLSPTQDPSAVNTGGHFPASILSNTTAAETTSEYLSPTQDPSAVKTGGHFSASILSNATVEETTSEYLSPTQNPSGIILETSEPVRHPPSVLPTTKIAETALDSSTPPPQEYPCTSEAEGTASEWSPHLSNLANTTVGQPTLDSPRHLEPFSLDNVAGEIAMESLAFPEPPVALTEDTESSISLSSGRGGPPTHTEAPEEDPRQNLPNYVNRQFPPGGRSSTPFSQASTLQNSTYVNDDLSRHPSEVEPSPTAQPDPLPSANTLPASRRQPPGSPAQSTHPHAPRLDTNLDRLHVLESDNEDSRSTVRERSGSPADFRGMGDHFNQSSPQRE